MDSFVSGNSRILPILRFNRMLFHDEVEALERRVLHKQQLNTFLKDRLKRITEVYPIPLDLDVARLSC